MVNPIIGPVLYVNSPEAKETQQNAALRVYLPQENSLQTAFAKHVNVPTQEAEANHPFLPGFSHLTALKMEEGANSNQNNHYLALRNSLSPVLQEKLEKDEEQANLEDRDPDLVALKTCLELQATILTMTDAMTAKNLDTTKITSSQAEYRQLNDRLQTQIIQYGAQASQWLDNYLSQTTSNPFTIDILLSVSHQIKEVLEILNSDSKNVMH